MSTQPDTALFTDAPACKTVPRGPIASDDQNADVCTEPTDTMQTRFASREELLTYVSEFSLAQGFAVVIYKSNRPRGQLWLRCDLGGAVRESAATAASASAPAAVETGTRKRKVSERLQSCPFRLYGRRLMDDAWVLTVQNDIHTHALALRKQDLVRHPMARRLSLAQKRIVLELTDVGVRPTVIVERLKTLFPDKPIKAQDIYNARNHIRMERLAGRIPFPETAEGGVEKHGTGVDDRTPPPRFAVSPSRQRGTAELQRLWTAVQDTVPQWSNEKQTDFIRTVYRLLVSHDVARSPTRNVSPITQANVAPLPQGELLPRSENEPVDKESRIP